MMKTSTGSPYATYAACALFALLTVLSLAAAGCSNPGATSTTAPSGPVTENIGGALAVGGLSSHAFTASASGTITVTLTSLTAPAPVVGLGLGVYSDATFVCSLSTSVNTAPGTTAQISTAVDAGNYCVEVYDIGNLTAPLGFAISIVHP